MQNQDSTFHLVTFPTLLTIGFSIPKTHMITVSMNASLLEKTICFILLCETKFSKSKKNKTAYDNRYIDHKLSKRTPEKNLLIKQSVSDILQKERIPSQQS